MHLAFWKLGGGFWQPIIASPENAQLFVKACMALHNFLQVEQSSVYCPQGFADREDSTGKVVCCAWCNGMEDGGMMPVTRAASNSYTAHAKALRDRLATYFVSPSGSVSWQVDAVTTVC